MKITAIQSLQIEVNELKFEIDNNVNLSRDQKIEREEQVKEFEDAIKILKEASSKTPSVGKNEGKKEVWASCPSCKEVNMYNSESKLCWSCGYVGTN